MHEAERRRHDEGREIAHQPFPTACYAPFSSLYLHTVGRVTTCCVSTYVLGSVAEQTLLDIWRGPRAQALRAALLGYDLSKGCSFCAWQVATPDGPPAFALEFDGTRVDGPEPAWPTQIDFAMSNTCNLECVMCTGELSSRIRSRREHRPPLPRVYDDAFFDGLVPFLPHLERAGFLGGEPFLAAETFRVWDLMAGLGLRTPCSVVTNGTIWNDRVEAVLDRFPVSVTVSVDGATAATVEAIRIGASHAAILANVARFAAYARDRGTELRLSFCLLRSNWQELADLLLQADALDVDVHVNTVTDPVHGLAQLPEAELARVLAGMEARDEALGGALGRNQGVWDAERTRVRGWLAARRLEDAHPGAVSARSLYLIDSRAATLPDDLRVPEGPRAVSMADAEAIVRAALPDGTLSVLYCDDDDRVVAVGDGGFLGLPAADCEGRPFAEVVHALARRHGEQVLPLDTEMVGAGVLRRVVHRDAEGRVTYLAGYGFAGELPGGGAGSITVAVQSSTTPAWDPAPAAGGA